ncbi:MAG: thioredoxin-disulfide reductase [candidate division KSB1 bacterium]|nr:thioredoxin-disulfide reductase [candidate division KSB1 bacterium]MDZ7335738.1 thioredoxin-disulfide reductase [candidate division KSB1 bacterium]MDZ7357511.1 thioredoxin-disulfide reductase [candidate division KSB1 bacterium]
MEGFMFSLKKDEDKVELADGYDVVVLGGGPAGLTAAIYAARARLTTLVVEKKEIGGEAAATDVIENYPGFPEGINGHALADRMVQQAKRFGAEIYYGEVAKLDLRSSPKTLLIDGKPINAQAVIIATGTSPKLLNVPGEKELKGRGVSYCATCDGPIYSGKDIAIIGGGNSGLQEGLFILKFVKSITLIEYMPKLNAEKILQEKFQSHPNTVTLLNHQVLSINGSGKVESITVKDRATGETKVIPVEGVFVYIGLIPNTELFKGQLALNQWGYIVTDEKLQASIPGVFVAGDVRDKGLRQVATAIGDGAVAAVSAEHYIEQLKSQE